MQRGGTMTPTLYYLPPSPPCRCILLLAKMLDLPLDLKVINILEGEQMKPEFLEMNPQHCVPTLNDDGLVLWESRAILSYMVSAFGKDDALYPKDVRVRALVDQRLMFDLGTLYQRMVEYYFPTMFMGAPLDETKKAKLNEALGWFDDILKGRQFSAAEQFTIADLTLMVTISQIEAFGFDLVSFNRVRQWYKRCKEFMQPYDYEELNGNQALVLAEMFKEKLQK
ncbi:glutathione S-transferase D7 isoform X2 [Stomoxys calcitrans]|uniref:Glutathione S-transferase D7 n=1 Tax=Stomoxys calcitrans TaxID=35570 RepID=A0A1I8NYC6_STOCA|nr:glutathione S-transferase D7 isoform X2 [Stomoxys calcitrans]